jgi:hypothetical protein
MSDIEQWSAIPRFEGYYEASTQGRVRSIDRWIPTKSGQTAFRRGRILTQRALAGNGYQIVMMSKHGKYQNQLVHRLVLLAFRGEPDHDYECRHLNGIRTDNRLENLAWGTRSENTADQVRHGSHRNSAKTHCLRGHAFTADNTYIRPSGGRMCRACRLIRGEVQGKYSRR